MSHANATGTPHEIKKSLYDSHTHTQSTAAHKKARDTFFKIHPRRRMGMRDVPPRALESIDCWLRIPPSYFRIKIRFGKLIKRAQRNCFIHDSSFSCSRKSNTLRYILTCFILIKTVASVNFR